jgi:antitoxin FitA
MCSAATTARPSGDISADNFVGEEMTKIVIQLPKEQADRLAELAKSLDTTVEDLAKAKLCEMVEKPDEEFQQALSYVLKKNADLYRRLA